MGKESLSILIVDDEPNIRDGISQHFLLDGHQTFTAKSGSDAIEIVKKHQIDFVITDIQMPDGDGEWLLEEIRRIDPNIPIVVLISGFTNLTKEQAISKGALDLLVKPIDMERLESYIRDCVESNSQNHG